MKLEEEQQKGNEYMKSAHEHVTKKQVEKDRKTLEIPMENGGHSINYKNYLSEIKNLHDKSPEKINSSTLRSVLEDPNVSEEKKLQKALKLIERKDRQFVKGNQNSELVDSIKSKMLVLNQMIR